MSLFPTLAFAFFQSPFSATFFGVCTFFAFNWVRHINILLRCAGFFCTWMEKSGFVWLCHITACRIHHPFNLLKELSQFFDMIECVKSSFLFLVLILVIIGAAPLTFSKNFDRKHLGMSQQLFPHILQYKKILPLMHHHYVLSNWILEIKGYFAITTAFQRFQSICF